jgi:hypothetical protein
MPKKREKENGKYPTRGLSSNHIDGVCEAVYASHVLVHIDGDSNHLQCARLKQGA